MRITLAIGLAGALLAPFAMGQKLELKFDHLKSKATEAVETNLDGAALELALKAMPQSGKDEKSDKLKMLSGLKGVYVRNFEFSKPGAYSDADLESVLKQVRGVPGWSSIVSVKEQQERTEIFLMTKEDQVLGLLILAAEAKELTIVNIVGSLTQDQVKELVKSNIRYDLANLPAAPKH